MPFLLAAVGAGAIACFIWIAARDVPAVLPEETSVAGEDRFSQALALAEAGDLDAAREAMQGLASTKGGDVRAHWWLAHDLLAWEHQKEEENEISRQELEQARMHLENVVHLDADHAEAPHLLVRTLVWLGEARKALTFLEEKAKQKPEFHVVAVDVAAGLGLKREREEHGIKAAAHFQRLCEDTEVEAAIREEACLHWAKAELALENFERTREILGATEGGELSSEGSALLLRSWQGTIGQEMAAGRGERVLQQLDAAADELGVHVRLVEAAANVAARAPEEVSAKLNGFYERAAEETAEDAAMQVALGSLALALGKASEGLEHLNRALEFDPEHVVALNNLAYGLAFLADPPEFERALDLLNRAVSAGKRWSDLPPSCWETRGQLLAKLERWEEAVVDLERALYSMPGHAEIHRTLATVYGAMGQSELAMQHQELAKRGKSP